MTRTFPVILLLLVAFVALASCAPAVQQADEASCGTTLSGHTTGLHKRFLGCFKPGSGKRKEKARFRSGEEEVQRETLTGESSGANAEKREWWTQREDESAKDFRNRCIAEAHRMFEDKKISEGQKTLMEDLAQQHYRTGGIDERTNSLASLHALIDGNKEERAKVQHDYAMYHLRKRLVYGGEKKEADMERPLLNDPHRWMKKANDIQAHWVQRLGEDRLPFFKRLRGQIKDCYEHDVADFDLPRDLSKVLRRMQRYAVGSENYEDYTYWLRELHDMVTTRLKPDNYNQDEDCRPSGEGSSSANDCRRSKHGKGTDQIDEDAGRARLYGPGYIPPMFYQEARFAGNKGVKEFWSLQKDESWSHLETRFRDQADACAKHGIINEVVRGLIKDSVENMKRCEDDAERQTYVIYIQELVESLANHGDYSVLSRDSEASD